MKGKHGYKRDVTSGDRSLQDQIIAHNKVTKLSHYTTLDSLKAILKKKEWLLNRIDLVDDNDECRIIGDNEVAERIFWACFTFTNEESPYHWKEYGKNKQEKAVCISLYKPENCTILKGLIDNSRPIMDYTNQTRYRWFG